MPSDTSPSLLTRDESVGVKGLLIFLVVLGHNSLAMEYTGLYSLLYSFHVYCFYILPFLYGATAVESWKPTTAVAASDMPHNSTNQ